jgi:hypothetical protein
METPAKGGWAMSWKVNKEDFVTRKKIAKLTFGKLFQGKIRGIGTITNVTLLIYCYVPKEVIGKKH